MTKLQADRLPLSRFALPLVLLAATAFTSCSSVKNRLGMGSEQGAVEEIVSEGGEVDIDLGANDLAIDPASSESFIYDTVLMNVRINGVVRPVVFQLYPEVAPKTVKNFKTKIINGEYDGTAFHRAISRYIVQGGDPLTKDNGNRSEWGTGGNDETVPAEIKLPHRQGAVAMARLGNAQNPSKKSSAYQFYIALRDLPALNGQYTVFAQVTQGLEVLDDMSKIVVDSNDAPVRRVDIVSMNLVPATITIEDPGAVPSVGGRKATVPDSKKGPVTRFIEKIW